MPHRLLLKFANYFNKICFILILTSLKKPGIFIINYEHVGSLFLNFHRNTFLITLIKMDIS